MHKQIKEVIKILELDLRDKVVLTEVGTGPFAYIGLIAAMANAKKVLIWTRDSQYGSAVDNVTNIKSLISEWNADYFDANVEISIDKRPKSHIQMADIVTNSGFIRPIDASFISEMKKNAVIAYMAEAWEFREEDVDLKACKSYGVDIGGTWENHPSIKVFDVCGDLALKMVEDAKLTLNDKSVLIISGDSFGEVILNSFSGYTSIELSASSDLANIDPNNFDLIFIADYVSGDQIIGSNGALKFRKDCKVAIIHLAGKVDIEFSRANNLYVFPDIEGDSYRMTRTLAYLGNDPVLKLHAAGLKVGELIHNREPNDLVQIIEL